MKIILGLMNFGPDASNGGRVTTLADFNCVLDYFQGQGFNEVDTARLYVAGKQEAFTAKAHWKERGLTLATKWYPYSAGAHKAEVLKAKFAESLQELETDYVDTFYLHAPDRSTPFEETLQALDELHKQRKFGKFGLSNFTSFEVAEIVMICKANSWVRPTVYQGAYNAISTLLSHTDST
jgi:aflatoxin B1 aldehyde reductase